MWMWLWIVPSVVAVVVIVMVVAKRPASPTPPAAATETFVGKWVEYWPDISEHATHTITRRGDDYQIEGTSPLTERYRISNVSTGEDCLRFSEGTATFVVEYELRIKDAQTISVRAKGTGGWQDDIVWRRA